MNFKSILQSVDASPMNLLIEGIVIQIVDTAICLNHFNELHYSGIMWKIIESS